jgi:hypothetical protein
MKDNVPFPARRIILALFFAIVAVLAVGYLMISLNPVEKSIKLSTQDHNENRLDKIRSFSDTKSTFEKSSNSRESDLSKNNRVETFKTESNEKYIEDSARRLDSAKNASRVLSINDGALKSSLETGSLGNSLLPAAPLSLTNTISHDIIYVPVGVSVPAVLAQPIAKSALDPISQEEVNAMADKFLRSMDEQVRTGTPMVSAWEQLQKRSDDAFRARYGWEAFNRESASANQQATVPH